MRSKHIRADAILDIAFDLGLYSPRIVAVEDWDSSRVFMLTHGQRGLTQTIRINPALSPEGVRLAIEDAVRPQPELPARSPRKRKASGVGATQS